ncbi:MAG: hypothetical protein V1929_05890 [bacterium]
MLVALNDVFCPACLCSLKNTVIVWVRSRNKAAMDAARSRPRPNFGRLSTSCVSSSMSRVVQFVAELA